MPEHSERTLPPWRHGRIDNVQMIQVVEVSYTRGKGRDGDPIRACKSWWTVEGERLADYDPEDDRSIPLDH